MKLIKEIQFSKRKFVESLDSTLHSILQIFSASSAPSEDTYNIQTWSLLKIDTVFTKLKADFGLVDSLVNLLIKSSLKGDVVTGRKKSSNKDCIKRTKSEKLYSKSVYQVSPTP